MATCVEDDTATVVVISNCSSTKRTQKSMVPSLAAMARATFGNQMPQYLNSFSAMDGRDRPLKN
jgi:hypothetical protein